MCGALNKSQHGGMTPGWLLEYLGFMSGAFRNLLEALEAMEANRSVMPSFTILHDNDSISRCPVQRHLPKT
jgi:hypothetical protein